MMVPSLHQQTTNTIKDGFQDFTPPPPKKKETQYTDHKDCFQAYTKKQQHNTQTIMMVSKPTSTNYLYNTEAIMMIS